METNDTPSKILKLPDRVVNLIAAGEVIQRPWNAVKELIENSLDARATEIHVTVKNGGMKLLQVQDNGRGIAFSDLELLCHRYATSKLRDFEDLKSISTYGFRGEALASISQVSHLTVLSRTKTTLLGFRAQYEDGVLKEKPKPCASNRGTQITAEDLFYNMSDRRSALKSAGEEMKKIADVVGKYAIHNSNVAFSLKKHGETVMEIRTGICLANRDPNRSPTVAAIGSVYGAQLARELLHFRCDDCPTLAFKAEGYASLPGHSGKQYIFILFINNRLVECSVMKRALESIYTSYGPAKSVAPFIYLKMEIEPHHVDVNVHPAKYVVQFLHEQEIIAVVETTLKNVLNSCTVSKSFVVKDFPTVPSQDSSLCQRDTRRIHSDPPRFQQEAGKGNQKVEPHRMVRTDGSGRRLDEFAFSKQLSTSQNIRVNFTGYDKEERPSISTNMQILQQSVLRDKETSPVESRREYITSEEVQILYDDEIRQPAWRHIHLNSILKLQQVVREKCPPDLRSIIAGHTFVGCVDEKYAMVQHETGLYLMNTTTLSQELFYQILLFQFQNFGALKLNQKCRLIDLISLGMPPNIMDKRQKVHECANFLMSKSEMLWDYFSLQLTDGYLISIPWLLEKYTPQLEGLPFYLYQLATMVDWKTEESCFATFCRETSKFYSFKKKYCHGEKTAGISTGAKEDWRSMVETVLYPAMKAKLLLPRRFLNSSTITKVTDMHDLYRVFERC